MHELLVALVCLTCTSPRWIHCVTQASVSILQVPLTKSRPHRSSGLNISYSRKRPSRYIEGRVRDFIHGVTMLPRTKSRSSKHCGALSKPCCNLITEPPVQIFVKNLEGRTAIVRVHRHQMVSAIKLQLQGKMDIDVSQFRLQYQGKVLDESATVHQCGIGKDATVQLTFGLKGGLPGYPTVDNRELHSFTWWRH